MTPRRVATWWASLDGVDVALALAVGASLVAAAVAFALASFGEFGYGR